MAKLSFTEALDQALELLEQGHPLEYCVRQFPEYSEELRPLLMVSADLHSLADVSFPPFDKASVEPDWETILAQTPQQPQRRFKTYGLGLGELFHSLQYHPVQRYASLAAAIIILCMVSWRGTSQSAADSVLYPIKRSVEQVEVVAAQDPAERISLHIRFAHRRLNELRTLAYQEQRIEPPLITALIQETQHAIAQVKQGGVNRVAAYEQLNALLTETDASLDHLKQLGLAAPPEDVAILESAASTVSTLRNDLASVVAPVAEQPTPTPVTIAEASKTPTATVPAATPVVDGTALGVDPSAPDSDITASEPEDPTAQPTRVVPTTTPAPQPTATFVPVTATATAPAPAVAAPAAPLVTPTATPATPTATPATPTATPTATPATPTAAPTTAATAEPTLAPTVDIAPVQTVQPTPGPTVPAVVVSPEPTSVPTATPAETTPAPTIVATASPTVVPTPEPTVVPTPEPTVVETATPEATEEPSFDPPVELIPAPTAEETATAEATSTPMVEPTPAPTAEEIATTEPTAELTPTGEPTSTPTTEPDAAPTSEPVDVPLPTEVPTDIPTVDVTIITLPPAFPTPPGGEATATPTVTVVPTPDTDPDPIATVPAETTSEPTTTPTAATPTSEPVADEPTPQPTPEEHDSSAGGEDSADTTMSARRVTTSSSVKQPTSPSSGQAVTDSLATQDSSMIKTQALSDASLVAEPDTELPQGGVEAKRHLHATLNRENKLQITIQPR